jgi:hypothetical protein
VREPGGRDLVKDHHESLIGSDGVARTLFAARSITACALAIAESSVKSPSGGRPRPLIHP